MDESKCENREGPDWLIVSTLNNNYVILYQLLSFGKVR